MAEHRIYPHAPFEALAPGVWRVKGGLPFPLTRNMIVIRLAGGELLLHSVVALDDAGMKALEALGHPAYAIVPSAAHKMDSPFYKARYPAIAMLAPAAIRDRAASNVAITGTVEEILPRLNIKLHAVPATRTHEYVYEVPMPAGGTMLMFNDVLGNVGAGAPGFVGQNIMPHVTVPRGGPTVPRIFRWTQVRDVAAVRRFIGGLADIPDLRLATVSHGDPITSDVAAKLRSVAGLTA